MIQELVTLDEVKKYLSIIEPDDDELLEYYIKGTSSFILKLTSRLFFEDVPDDIKLACCEIIGVKYAKRTRLGKDNETLSGQLVNYSKEDLTDFAQRTVDANKCWIPPNAQKAQRYE